MKKLTILLVILLVVTIPLQAHAAARTVSITPKLSFSGTTALCEAIVVGNNSSEYIEVTMKLLYLGTYVASCSDEGYGYVSINHSVAVTGKRTYKLVVEVTIDGVKQDPVYVTGTC